MDAVVGTALTISRDTKTSCSSGESELISDADMAKDVCTGSSGVGKTLQTWPPIEARRLDL